MRTIKWAVSARSLSVSVLLANSRVDDKSQYWGSQVIALIRATFAELVTTDNEALIRTHHPALSHQPFVEVVKQDERSIWSVFH